MSEPDGTIWKGLQQGTALVVRQLEATVAQQAAEIERLTRERDDARENSNKAVWAAQKCETERDTAQAAPATARREAFFAGHAAGEKYSTDQDWGMRGTHWEASFMEYEESLTNKEAPNDPAE